MRSPLPVVLALCWCLTLQSCGMLTAETERRNQLWEQYTAQALAAEREKKYQEAERLYKQALEIASKFPKTDLRSTLTAIDLAKIYHAEGKDEIAQDTYEDAIAAYEQWKPSRAEHEEENRIGKKMASCYQGLAEIYAANNRVADAEKMYEKALEFTKKGYYTRRFINELREEYAVFLRKNGNSKKADALLEPAKAISEGFEASVTNKSMVDLEWTRARGEASNAAGKGDLHRAAQICAQAASDARTKYGADDQRTIEMMIDQANYLAQAKKLAEADAVLKAALRDHGEKKDPVLGLLYNAMSQVHFDMKKYEQAVEDGKRAGAVGRELTEGQIESDGYFLVANAYRQMGRRQDTIDYLKQAQKARSGYSYDYAYYLIVNTLGEMYIEDERLSDARTLLEEAASMQKKFQPTREYERTLHNLAQVYEKQGETDKARQALAEIKRVKQS